MSNEITESSRPSDVKLTPVRAGEHVNSFASSPLRKAELEWALEAYVRACVALGDRWQALLASDVERSAWRDFETLARHGWLVRKGEGYAGSSRFFVWLRSAGYLA